MAIAQRDVTVTGGCQCGAVRYRATALLGTAHICHCRMCQKAVGNLFAPFVAAPRGAFAWTRGEPARFMSSAYVARIFCRECGTPLAYDYVGGDHVSLTLGSLDRPAEVVPRDQVGTEGRVPWFDSLPGLPDRGTTEADMPEIAKQIAASNNQHPDHD